MIAVLDNDILFKGACYGLLDELVGTICRTNETGVLGSSRFVVTSLIERTVLNRDRSIALEGLFDFLSAAAILEPVEDEVKMAADLELSAQRAGANFDGGESLLCAILVQRLLSLLVTGDKRAIVAIETILDTDVRLRFISGKVKCLEQLFASSIAQYGCDHVRFAVCAEAQIDKALSICFGCKSDPVVDGSIWDGLQSYINDLRRRAGRVLAP